MEIRLTDTNNDLVYKIVDMLNLFQMSDEFRFTYDVEVFGSKKFGIKIRNIRLKEAKHYCGNHPASCELRPFGGGPERKAKYLEGADWVTFNDFINDLLDVMEVSANVKTAVCIVRKGRARRVAYGMYEDRPGFMEWTMDQPVEDWQDWIGEKCVSSFYPVGTPGEYTREFYKEEIGVV